MANDEKKQAEIIERVRNRFIKLSAEYQLNKPDMRIGIAIIDGKLKYAIINKADIVDGEIKLSKIMDLDFLEKMFESVIRGYIMDNMKRLIGETGSQFTDARIFAKNPNCDLAVGLFVENKYVRTITIEEIITNNT